MRHWSHRPGAVDHRNAAEDRPRQLLGRVRLRLDARRALLEQRVERLDRRTQGIRIDQQSGADQQLVEQTHPEPDRGTRLAGRLVLEQRGAVLLSSSGELSASRDDDQRQALGASFAGSSQCLDRLTRVAGCNDQGSIARPGRQRQREQAEQRIAAHRRDIA